MGNCFVTRKEKLVRCRWVYIKLMELLIDINQDWYSQRLYTDVRC